MLVYHRIPSMEQLGVCYPLNGMLVNLIAELHPFWIGFCEWFACGHLYTLVEGDIVKQSCRS